ncbi:MAG: elongation factor P--(R)-beta-lysine ligase, partial [Spirochaetaceae bacterium]|nr:elongation factor P--(R)-beta-lysine ligase [Spirochaetaceae bacterium]MCF7952360.1 elongation factor P--(R)-beta-lysine ligase [Spirochaetaceae bacterium]
RPPFRKMTVRKAFLDYAGFDLAKTQDKPALILAAQKLGLSIQPKEDTWEQIYHRIFLSYVEPNLPSNQPLVLTDFPRQITCLAKEIPGTPWRERWELYINGIELANCYSEETDPRKIESFFRREYAQKAAESRVVPDIDEEFIDIHRSGFPTCSGVALGVDRLIMALSGQADIQGVIFFPLSDTMRL